VTAPTRRPAKAGETNPVNQTCALCGTPTGGTGLICTACVTLPTPVSAGAR
jgi:hypothetical protein